MKHGVVIVIAAVLDFILLVYQAAIWTLKSVTLFMPTLMALANLKNTKNLGATILLTPALFLPVSISIITGSPGSPLSGGTG